MRQLDTFFEKISKESADAASAHPGPVDNESLFEEGKFKEHLIVELDYKLVPVEGWQMLLDTFGLADGQEPVERKVMIRIMKGLLEL